MRSTALLDGCGIALAVYFVQGQVFAALVVHENLHRMFLNKEAWA